MLSCSEPIASSCSGKTMRDQLKSSKIWNPTASPRALQSW
jgi:hypothetical protein